MRVSRTEQLKRALFRGDSLHLENPLYAECLRAIAGELLRSDIGAGDLTAQSLELTDEHATGEVIAKATGVVAGIAEMSWLLRRSNIAVQTKKKDGDSLEYGETVLELEGKRSDLLAHERVGLNLLQRMSGIATMTQKYQTQVQEQSPTAYVVGTRKTPWGLLDKRALHLGGGGTHRLGLWDAILVKNNHLALLADREDEAARIAAQRAWQRRGTAAFIEIEVRSERSAVAAAQMFGELQHRERTSNGTTNGTANGSIDAALDNCPCLLLLDNMTAQQVNHVVEKLRVEDLLQYVLIEVSGAILATNLDAYANCGADAISIGALTHSAQALDLSQKVAFIGSTQPTW
jgi:nicotinate-nucleotide pyrophosphorylase (carboxylating)